MKKPTLKTTLTNEEQTELLAYYDYVDALIATNATTTTERDKLKTTNEELVITNRKYFDRLTAEIDPKKKDPQEEEAPSCLDLAGTLLKEKTGGK